MDQFIGLDLQQFAAFLDQILEGSVPVYSSVEGVKMMGVVAVKMSEGLCDKDNGLGRDEQILTAIMVLASALEVVMKDAELAAVPVGRVQ